VLETETVVETGRPAVARIGTAEARELHAAGATFVDVLPASDYDEWHLPGAVSIPMPDLASKALDGLDRAAPVVVYCFDHECDLSARAAHRLATLGFERAHDYVGSKVAWVAAGLPVEGAANTGTWAGALVHDVATCPPDATVGDVRDALREHGLCVVLDDERIVIGVVRAEPAALPADTPVERVLQPGPSTVRPSITARELTESMDRQGEQHVLVTTYDGRLLGIVRRGDLDRVVT
jgi:rhodanese-related sulfurtransferase/CBS domain-containing protein